jgi:hypothetical protein
MWYRKRTGPKVRVFTQIRFSGMETNQEKVGKEDPVYDSGTTGF